MCERGNGSWGNLAVIVPDRLMWNFCGGDGVTVSTFKPFGDSCGQTLF